MSNLDKVQKIIIEAGGKSYRRPYAEDDMQDLRNKIDDVVRKWARQRMFPDGVPEDDLSQLDVKRMALHALSLSILDIQDVGETDEDITGFTQEVVAELEHLIAVFLGLPHPKKPDGCRGRACDELMRNWRS